MYIKNYSQYIKEDLSSDKYNYFIAYMNVYGRSNIRTFDEIILEVYENCQIIFTGDAIINTDNGYNFCSLEYKVINPKDEEIGIKTGMQQGDNAVFLSVEDNELVIKDPNSDKNKFSSKRDLINFIEMLNKFYTKEDKETQYKILGKLNNRTLSKVDDGPFCKWIKNNFGSFKKMEETIIYEKYYR